jgi:hypothetical protein
MNEYSAISPLADREGRVVVIVAARAASHEVAAALAYTVKPV